MVTTYQLSARELDDAFLASLKALYKDRTITITVRDEDNDDMDETEYLLSNEANREFLLEAVERVRNREGLIEVSLDELQ